MTVARYASPGGGNEAQAVASTNVAARTVFGGPSTPSSTILVWVRDTNSRSSLSSPYLWVGDAVFNQTSLVLYGNNTPGTGAVSGIYDDTGDPIYPGLGARVTDEWRHHAIVLDRDTSLAKSYGDGAEVSSVDISTFDLDDEQDVLELFPYGYSYGEVAGIAIFSRALSSAEIAAAYAAGINHDLREDHDEAGWDGETPVVYWISSGDGTTIPNDGEGGECNLVLGPKMWTAQASNESPPSSTPLIGSINKYPPVRTYYSLPGTAGANLRALGTRLPRAVFPDGGGLGTFSLRAWLKRPAVPSVLTGTVLHVTSGGSQLTVSVGGVGGDEITVTLDDGTTTVTDTDTIPLGDWFLWGLVQDNVAETLKLHINGLSIFEIDTSSLTVPDADTGMSWTFGTLDDGTTELDFDITSILVTIDVADTEDDQLEIFWEGRYGYQVDADDPPLDYTYWTEPPVDDVVPDSGYTTIEVPLLVNVEVTVETEAGTFHAWWLGDHRIGVFSSAWWPESAHDPDAWGLAFATAAHADVFGECPRIIAVTPREDGALQLDLDAKAHPGIGYSLTGPADLTGEVP